MAELTKGHITTKNKKLGIWEIIEDGESCRIFMTCPECSAIQDLSRFDFNSYGTTNTCVVCRACQQHQDIVLKDWDPTPILNAALTKAKTMLATLDEALSGQRPIRLQNDCTTMASIFGIRGLIEIANDDGSFSEDKDRWFNIRPCPALREHELSVEDLCIGSPFDSMLLRAAALAPAADRLREDLGNLRFGIRDIRIPKGRLHKLLGMARLKKRYRLPCKCDFCSRQRRSVPDPRLFEGTDYVFNRQMTQLTKREDQ